MQDLKQRVLFYLSSLGIKSKRLLDISVLKNKPKRFSAGIEQYVLLSEKSSAF